MNKDALLSLIDEGIAFSDERAVTHRFTEDGAKYLRIRGLLQQFRARITAALAEKDGGWMPIETAPKDGTEVWGYREDAGAFLMRYTAPIHFCTESELAEMGEESAEQEDWFYADFIAGGRLEGSEAPTHWQPLPALPKEKL